MDKLIQQDQLLLFNCESVISLGSMPVPGDDAPENVIITRRKRGKANLEQCRISAIHMSISFVYLLPAYILDANTAKGRLYVTIKPDSNVGRSNSHC